MVHMGISLWDGVEHLIFGCSASLSTSTYKTYHTVRLRGVEMPTTLLIRRKFKTIG